MFQFHFGTYNTKRVNLDNTSLMNINELAMRMTTQKTNACRYHRKFKFVRSRLPQLWFHTFHFETARLVKTCMFWMIIHVFSVAQLVGASFRIPFYAIRFLILYFLSTFYMLCFFDCAHTLE